MVCILKKSALDKKSDNNIEIINLKNNSEKIDKLIDNKTFFRAYHMNKNHCFTIVSDGSLGDEIIFELIDESYNLI